MAAAAAAITGTAAAAAVAMAAKRLQQQQQQQRRRNPAESEVRQFANTAAHQGAVLLPAAGVERQQQLTRMAQQQ